MKSRHIARSQLEAMNLPPLILKIFDGVPGIPELSFRCESPYHIFTSAPDNLVPLVPMWECGTIVTGARSDGQGFLKFSLELPHEPLWHLSKFTQVASDLLIDLWEDEIDDPALDRISEGFGFKSLETLLSKLNEGPSGDYREWRKAIVTSF